MQFDKLGPYRLGKKLGQGGMGAVYEGHDAASGQAAAIKVLAPQLATEEGFRVRFESEIESLKKLRHPNIVRLYGYGEEAGYLFYAMELVDGTSLEEELRAGRRFGRREVTQIAIKLCRALKHAHDHGIIHRDIKPANLLLGKDGEIRLSDFGIARLFGNTRLTNDGGVLGTAEYMAPEQADGRPVTDRCDQYSLGGVMYALLTGRPPFRAGTLVEMLQLQRFAEPQPVRRYAPDTPAELDRIIGQLLEKDPQKRFVNALILARSLEAMERGLSLSAERSDFILPGETDPGLPQLALSLGPTQVPPDASNAELAGVSTAPGLEAVHSLSAMPEPQAAGATGSPPAGKVFTKVEDTVVDRSRWRDELWGTLGSWQTLAALAALAAIAFLVLRGLEGPSADQLYGEIDAAAERHQPAALGEAAGKMREFLDRFPEDARTAQVQSLFDEVQAVREQRRIEIRRRRLQASPTQSAAERAFVDASTIKASNPDLAIEKLRSLVDLYASPDGREHDEESVRLARTELALLERQAAENVQADRQAIRDQLARADALAAKDAAYARRIWQAIVTLYGDKPWAAEEVAAARGKLAETAAEEDADEHNLPAKEAAAPAAQPSRAN